MNKLFTKKQLQQEAGNTIFQRGKKYFLSKTVGKITIKKGNYIAKVRGTYNYEVIYNHNNNKFSCSCPYGSFCKHRVAFGLKLIKEWGDLQKTIQNINNEYNSIDDELKIEFLQKILSENIDIKIEFDRFCKFKTKEVSDVDIEEVAQEIYDELSFYDAEYIYDQMPSGYYQEPYETAYEILEEKLGEFEDILKEYLDNNHFDNALLYFLGIVLGILNAEETEIGEMVGDIFESYYSSMEIFTKSIARQNQNIQKQVLESFFKQIKKYEKLRLWDAYSSFFDIYYKNKELTILLKNNIIKYSSENRALDIIRRVEKKLGNTSNIKKLAEQNTDDFKLAIEYLIILQKEKKYIQIKKVLNYWFDKDDNWHLKELEQFVTQDIGQADYELFLQKLILRAKSFTAFKKLRKSIKDNKVEEIVSKLNDEDLIHNILLFEKQFKKILQKIQNNFKNKKNDFFYYNYKKYLKDIEKKFPIEAWNLYKNDIDNQMNSYKRNRNTYSNIADIIKKMDKLDKTRTQFVIKELYNRKPNLPALKDEFRKAKLI